MTFGERFKKLRLSAGIGLREFCANAQVDAAYWSKVERGILPPEIETQNDWRLVVAYIGIDLESDEGLELERLADEWKPDQVRAIDLMPAFPVNKDGSRPTEQQLTDLYEDIEGGLK